MPKIDHMVFVTIRPDADAEMEKAMSFFRTEITKHLSGIETLSIGKNFTNRGGTFTHALYVRFSSREALEAYGPSDIHQQFVSMLKKISPPGEFSDHVRAIDYEIVEP